MDGIFSDSNPFTRARKRRQLGQGYQAGATQQQEPVEFSPQEENDLLETIGRGALSGLNAVGESLDKMTGSRALRGLLGGKPRELLSVVPFSDTIGLTDPNQITYGKDLLGWDDPGSAADDVAGFALDFALDPTWVVGGPVISKAGLAAKAAGLTGKAGKFKSLMKVAGKGKNELAMSTTLRELLQHGTLDKAGNELPEAISVFKKGDPSKHVTTLQKMYDPHPVKKATEFDDLENWAKANKQDIWDLLDEPLQESMASIKVPFTDIHLAKIGKGNKALRTAGVVDAAGRLITAPLQGYGVKANEEAIAKFRERMRAEAPANITDEQLDMHLRMYKAYTEGVLGKDFGQYLRTHGLEMGDQTPPTAGNTMWQGLWYSKLPMVVEQNTNKRFGLNELKAMAKKAGVKDEEIEWAELDELFSGKDPGHKATKTEVLEWLNKTLDPDQLIEEVDNATIRGNAQGGTVTPGGVPGTVRTWALRSPKVGAGATTGHLGDITDPVGYIRVQDWQMPNGKKALLLENIQSDLHQLGAKEGYASTSDMQALQKRREESLRQMEQWQIARESARDRYDSATDTLYSELTKRFGEGAADRYETASHNIRRYLQDYPNHLDDLDPEQSLQERMSLISNKDNRSVYDKVESMARDDDSLDRVLSDYHSAREDWFDVERRTEPYIPYEKDVAPNLPFKGNRWIEKLLQKAAKEAVNGGYDEIRITPGIDQVDRWGHPWLEKFYDETVRDAAKRALGVTPKQSKVASRNLLDWQHRGYDEDWKLTGLGKNGETVVTIERSPPGSSKEFVLRNADGNVVEGDTVAELTDIANKKHSTVHNTVTSIPVSDIKRGPYSLFQGAGDQPKWYSKLSQTIRNKVQGKTIGVEDLKRLIKNSDIKQGELDAADLDWFLEDSFDGVVDGKVSKEQLLYYLDNRLKADTVEVVSRTRGNPDDALKTLYGPAFEANRGIKTRLNYGPKSDPQTYTEKLIRANNTRGAVYDPHWGAGGNGVISHVRGEDVTLDGRKYFGLHEFQSFDGEAAHGAKKHGTATLQELLDNVKNWPASPLHIRPATDVNATDFIARYKRLVRTHGVPDEATDELARIGGKSLEEYDQFSGYLEALASYYKDISESLKHDKLKAGNLPFLEAHEAVALREYASNLAYKADRLRRGKNHLRDKTPFVSNDQWMQTGSRALLKDLVEQGYEGIILPRGKDHPFKTHSEGLEELYDNIVPAVFGKQVKKYGGKADELKTLFPREAAGSKALGNSRVIQFNDEIRKAFKGPQPIFQGGQTAPKAATTFLPDGRTILQTFGAADFSSHVHEFVHVILKSLPQEMFEKINKALGKAKGSKWANLTTAEHEKLAEGFEKFWLNGSKPSGELSDIWGNIQGFMASVYNTAAAKGQLADVTPEIDAMYRQLIQGRPDELRGYTIPSMGKTTRKVAQAIDKAGDKVGNWPATRLANRLFNASVMGNKLPFGQDMAREIHAATPEARQAALETGMLNIQEMADKGILDDPGAHKKMLSQYEGFKPAAGQTKKPVQRGMAAVDNVFAQLKKIGGDPGELGDKSMPRFHPRQGPEDAFNLDDLFTERRLGKKNDQQRKDWLENIAGGTRTLEFKIIRNPRLVGPTVADGGQKFDSVANAYQYLIADKKMRKNFPGLQVGVPENKIDKELLKQTKKDLRVLAKWLHELPEDTLQKGFYLHPEEAGRNYVVRNTEKLVRSKVILKHLIEQTTPYFDGTVKLAKGDKGATLGSILHNVNLKAGDFENGAVQHIAEALGIKNPKASLDAQLASGAIDQAKYNKEMRAWRKEVTGLRIPREHAKEFTRIRKFYEAPEEANIIFKALDSYTNLFKAGVLTAPARYARDALSSQIANYFIHAFSPRTVRDFDRFLRGKEMPLSQLTQLAPVMALLKRNNLKVTQKNANKMFRVHLGQMELMGERVSEFSQVGSVRALKGMENAYKAMPGVQPLGLKEAGQELIDKSKWKGFIKGLRPNWSTWGVRGVGDAKEITNPVMRAGNVTGTYIDAMARVPGYIELLKKGMSPAQAKAKIMAAHVDYSNRALSITERQVMTRAFPFYRFSRHTAEYVAKELLSNPHGRMAQVVRGGSRTQMQSEEGKIVPEHIARTLAIPMPKNALTDALGLSAPEGHTRYLTGLGLMHEDPLSLYQPGSTSYHTAKGTLQSLLGRANPVIKGPIELAMGKQAFSGRDLEDLDPNLGRIASNLTGKDTAYQTPILAEHAIANSPAARAVSSLRTATDTRPNAKTKAAINLLSGIRLSDMDNEKARNLARRKLLEEYLRSNPNVQRFEHLFATDDTKLNEQELALMNLYRQFSRQAAKKARERKKAEANK